MELTTGIIWGGLVGAVVGVGILKEKYDDYKRKEQEKIAQKMAINRSLEVISESVHFAINSKNMGTRLSRIDVAISVAEELVNDYPKIDEFLSQLTSFKDYRLELHMENIGNKINKHLDRANVAKTAATKISNASKALAEIEDGFRNEYTDKSRLEECKVSIENYIHQVQIEELKEKAERLEFKGQYSKAAAAYQDALFFIHRDNVDDSLQEEEISEFERKIEAMQISATAKIAARRKTTK